MFRVNMFMFLIVILWQALLQCHGTVLRQREFFTVHKWSHTLNMTFPNEIDKKFAVNNGFYDINRIQLPVDIDVEYRGKYT